MTNTTPDAEILKELGKRLALVRKNRKISQEELAIDAGVGVATLRRIESGSGGQMDSWVKILKALDLVSSLDSLLPEKIDSPMAEVLGEKRIARKKSPLGIVWGDESE